MTPVHQTLNAGLLPRLNISIGSPAGRKVGGLLCMIKQTVQAGRASDKIAWAQKMGRPP